MDSMGPPSTNWGRADFLFRYNEERPTIGSRFLVAGGGAGVLRRTGNEVDQRNHAGAEDRHVLDDVEVGEHGGLAVKLVVNVGLGRMGAGSAERITAAVAAELFLELCHLIHKGLAARREIARHITFVRGGASREHGGHEGRSAGA